MNYFCCNDVASESLSLSGIPPKKAARTFLSCGWHCGTPWNTHSSEIFAYPDPVGQHREEYNNMNKLASNTLGVWLGIRELKKMRLGCAVRCTEATLNAQNFTPHHPAIKHDQNIIHWPEKNQGTQRPKRIFDQAWSLQPLSFRTLLGLLQIAWGYLSSLANKYLAIEYYLTWCNVCLNWLAIITALLN